MRIILLSLVTTVFIFGGFFITTDTSLAALVPCDGPNCQTCDLVKLGNNIIKWLVEVMAVICALVIAVAGFKMVISAGNSGAITQAKEMITNTIIGFVILLAAWLIVDTVMKMFVNQAVLVGPWYQIQCVAQPTPTPTAPGGVTATTTTACTIPNLSPITDPIAQQMEGGQTVIWTNTAPQLQICANKFIGKVGGGSVTSAYRPQSYQTHLYEIRDRWCTQGLQSNTDPLCTTVKAAISSEVSKHFGYSWSCGAVAQTASTHSSGTGVDISGINHTAAAVQQAASDSCLTWNNYSGDPYHYTLKSNCSCN